ncbi:MAG: hypothetical protein H6729_08320 [Deltaproteobacteria bacterium]|nr:hypothetical protein [Deltaproteobacteria bacterium]
MMTSILALTLLGPSSALPLESRGDQGSAPSTDVRRFEGVAYTENGELAYRETHEVHTRAGRLVRSVTEYFDPSGQRIGELLSNYERDPFAPDYEFRDETGRVVEGAELKRDGLRLFYQGRGRFLPFSGNQVRADRATDDRGLNEREKDKLEADSQSNVARDTERLVVGQGLHQLARARMAELARGESLVVRFAIPSRFDSYLFRIEPVKTDDPQILRLRIAIDSWVLSLVAPSIEVDYDPVRRRLLAYRGVSNLTNANGESMQVSIRYSYPTGGRYAQ